MTAEPAESATPADLFEPVPGNFGAHGRFDSEAKSSSWEMFADRHRGAVRLAAAAGMMAVALRTGPTGNDDELAAWYLADKRVARGAMEAPLASELLPLGTRRFSVCLRRMLVRGCGGFVSLFRMLMRLGMIAFAVMFGRRVMGFGGIFMRFGRSLVTCLSHVSSLFHVQAFWPLKLHVMAASSCNSKTVSTHRSRTHHCSHALTLTHERT